MTIIENAKREMVLHQLLKRFGFVHQEYWFPLRHTVFSPVLALNIHAFLDSGLPEAVKGYCLRQSKCMYEVWEYDINGSPIWEIETQELEFDWYSEKVDVFADFSEMVYYSHEESITFAGEGLIKTIEVAYPDWETLRWK